MVGNQTTPKVRGMRKPGWGFTIVGVISFAISALAALMYCAHDSRMATKRQLLLWARPSVLVGSPKAC